MRQRNWDPGNRNVVCGYDRARRPLRPNDRWPLTATLRAPLSNATGRTDCVSRYPSHGGCLVHGREKKHVRRSRSQDGSPDVATAGDARTIAARRDSNGARLESSGNRRKNFWLHARILLRSGTPIKASVHQITISHSSGAAGPLTVQGRLNTRGMHEWGAALSKRRPR